MAVRKIDTLQEFENVIPRYRPFLDEALKHSKETITRDDIEHGIVSGRFQLWTTDNAICVVSSVIWREKTVLLLLLIGGERGKAISEILNEGQPVIEQYARSTGFCGLLGMGRSGWQRLLPRVGFELVEEETDNETFYFKELA